MSQGQLSGYLPVSLQEIKLSSSANDSTGKLSKVGRAYVNPAGVRKFSAL